MKALVLGATGHVGNAITRELLQRGWRVTTTSRQTEPPANLVGLSTTFRTGDADQPGQLKTWARGHELVVDAAAPYHFELGPGSIGSAALAGPRARMDALLESVSAQDATLAYVSSFTTLSRDRSLFQAVRKSALQRLHPYFELKREMETQVLEASRRGMKAIVVNPTVCLGPWDLKPLQHCLIPLALRGALPATTTHAVNAIDVRDVALATLNAVEQGRFGEPIPLWGHNTTMQGLIATICRLGGVQAPRLSVPATAIAAAAYGNEVLSALGLSPLAHPSLGLLLSLEQEWQSPGQVQCELGVRPRPLSRTLVEAIDWYTENGYLQAEDQGWS